MSAPLEHLNALEAHLLNDTAEILDAGAEPAQFLGRDAIMPVLARLHIRLFELQPSIETLRLCAQDPSS